MREWQRTQLRVLPARSAAGMGGNVERPESWSGMTRNRQVSLDSNQFAICLV
jgi:hypothetical protein